ncbi:MAG: MAPKK kinase [Olpidium bornovanus]|uniref:MAPKK kinase n=1 Tax=Olpidium bornovanus TaxID=278681 RepID=A0A8H7ZZE6_9FUNG|nr:MAG: MAPKK kinase [Olpidium bornovanus]
MNKIFRNLGVTGVDREICSGQRVSDFDCVLASGSIDPYFRGTASTAKQLGDSELVKFCRAAARTDKDLVLRKVHQPLRTLLSRQNQKKIFAAAHPWDPFFPRWGRKLESFLLEKNQANSRSSVSPVALQRQSEIFGERERPPSELITADLSRYFSGYHVPDWQRQQRKHQMAASRDRDLPPTPVMRLPSPDRSGWDKIQSGELELEEGEDDRRTDASSPQDSEVMASGRDDQSPPLQTPVTQEGRAPRQQNAGLSKWMKGEFIGKGSFGTVSLGLNPRSGELMAVKQVELPSSGGLAANEERRWSMLEALQREINLLKNLEHENIVRYIGSQVTETHLNIFLEYVPGGSVAGLLASYGAFEETLVRTFVKQILQGLSYLHERDIIHRDIKGGNILVDNKGCVKISDFGISKKVEDSVAASGAPANQLQRASLAGEMAPEVVKQTSYTQKADIWSLGCLIVEMFTGDHPFPEFNQMQAMFKIGTSSAPAIPEMISDDAKDFLGMTFLIDAASRPTASALLEHAFVVKLVDDE